jgi:ArsR family transcriptional regulator, arsenate/arsenite/antimonite-responsive transcriptional repressor
MQEAGIVDSLAALAQPQRLRAFRALVVAGPGGLTPSVLAGMLRIAPNALSFHLKTLAHARLVTAEQDGRHLIYRANFKTMNSVLGYLTEHCCEGAACEVKESPASTCRTC